MEQSKQTPRKKAYDKAYREKNLKRVPLDLFKRDYDALKSVANSTGMGVNGFIKAAIREKMERTLQNDENPPSD